MIKNFFHGLNSLGISYLVVSGQATVFYGAATFSEDIDLWLEPKIENWNKFFKFLGKIGARVYKLTPPIRLEFIQKGHGFHFQLYSKSEKPSVWFLDVMGMLPRVGSFKHAFRNTIYEKTDWGELPFISIRDLVKIKKTRRLEDYPVISNLVRIEYEKLSSSSIKSGDWKWLLTNSFEVEDILEYLGSCKLVRRIADSLERQCLSFCLKAMSNPKQEERYIELASKEIAVEIENLRREDRKYWGPIVSELKEMKESHQLLPLGSSPPGSVK